MDVEQALAAVGRRLERGEIVEVELAAAIEGISALPARMISAAPQAIADAAKLYRQQPSSSFFPEMFSPYLKNRRLLLQFPELAYLFLFHRDGLVRGAALKRIVGGLPSSFLFAAVTLRLNDWAQPVRVAALACAERCFPLTPAHVIAGAASVLVLRSDSWTRWDKERAALEASLARPDVSVCLADDLIAAQTGPASQVLRMALKRDALDQHLVRMAAEAKQPSVRAVAVQTIADGQAKWRAGSEWKWVDKSMGERILTPKFNCREIAVALPTERIVNAAISDRSALVRKTSLDALIRHSLGSERARDLALQLTNDPSRAVRERAAFILSRHKDAHPLPA